MFCISTFFCNFVFTLRENSRKYSAFVINNEIGKRLYEQRF